MHELVVTGTAAIGPFGNCADALWSALCSKTPSVLPRNGETQAFGEVQGFDVPKKVKSRRTDRAPRISQFALAVVSGAIAKASLSLKGINKDRVSLVYGTGNGPEDIIDRNLGLIFENGLNSVEPMGFQESVFNAPASLISIEYGFRGPLLALPMGWAAGGYALCAAADLVASGQTDAAIAVASDICGELSKPVDRKLRFVTPNDGKQACIRPFDIRANGSFISEGAAAVVIETKNSAKARGATVMADLTGWSIANDALGLGPRQGAHMGLANAMAMADSHAKGTDAILAGSYCTKDAEAAEAKAIMNYANNAAFQPVVTNVRGAIGEAKGVTGLWNIVAATQILSSGVVPYPLGCEHPNTTAGLRLPKACDTAPRTVMCNNFWIGGLNTCVRLEAPS